jgi:urate oxidase
MYVRTTRKLTLETDLSWHKGLKNTGKDAEVYAPQSSPNGLIKCEVSRS